MGPESSPIRDIHYAKAKNGQGTATFPCNSEKKMPRDE